MVGSDLTNIAHAEKMSTGIIVVAGYAAPTYDTEGMYFEWSDDRARTARAFRDGSTRKLIAHYVPLGDVPAQPTVELFPTTAILVSWVDGTFYQYASFDGGETWIAVT
jgi:hypothetical protein